MEKAKEKKTIEFISTFEWYTIEVTGAKPFTVRKINVFERAKKATHIRIRRGYTKECFEREITNVSQFKELCFISWNPNTQARKGYVKTEDAQKEILSYFDIKNEDKATVHAVLKCIELMQEQGDREIKSKLIKERKE